LNTSLIPFKIMSSFLLEKLLIMGATCRSPEQSTREVKGRSEIGFEYAEIPRECDAERLG